ncbi:MAG TPA: ATP synthase F0 subunit C [Kofleriaceae bacterium]|jgi:F-type H+-transporting ATPase subunit c|nr:ATP synthase F0 subunit C [Kofleriaceae bacterium]
MEPVFALGAGAAFDTSAAAALGIGLTGLGAALAQGRAVAAALEGSTRNPGVLAGARGLMILGLGMIESVLVLVAVFLMTKM